MRHFNLLSTVVLWYAVEAEAAPRPGLFAQAVDHVCGLYRCHLNIPNSHAHVLCKTTLSSVMIGAEYGSVVGCAQPTRVAA
jgi:hypothetical protein